MAKRFTRRAMLRGAGGAAITLPALEIMFDRHRKSYAQALTIPKRYVVCFCGQSLGGDDDPLHNDYVPNTVGANYDLKSALAPLAPVQADVSVVSGISIPTANGGVYFTRFSRPSSVDFQHRMRSKAEAADITSKVLAGIGALSLSFALSINF